MNNTVTERINHLPQFSLLAEYADPLTIVEYGGVVPSNGMQLQSVRLRPLPIAKIVQEVLDRTASKTTFYVDPITSLVSAIYYVDFAENNSNAQTQVHVLLSDYRSINGIQVPFRQTTYRDGTPESDLVLNSVEFNLGLSDSEFVLPQ